MKFNYFRYVIWGGIIFSLVVSAFGMPSVGFAQSTQGWSDPVNLSNSGSSTAPSIVVDSNGTIHVIWLDEFDGYQYTESTDGGTTWSVVKTAAFPFSPKGDFPPVFVAGHNGEIHIFWQDSTYALFYSQAQSSTLSVPSSWTGNLKLSDSVISFDASVSAANILHVGYIRNLVTELKPSGVYYQRLDGGGWSPATNLYSSKYYRSVLPANSNISIAVSTVENRDRVLMSWDDRPQKRIFWSKSSDGGTTWDQAQQVSGPEQSVGSEMPYNIKISSVDGKILLSWQVGIPGSRCTQTSQWSLDGGTQFLAPVKFLDDFISCPKQIYVVTANQDFSVSLINIQDEISLIAWNGEKWSKRQPQGELSTFVNPLTFDNVLFGCQATAFHDGTLYIVGCDTGTGGDIWFRSRPLGSIDDWFPPPSAWTSPSVVATTRQGISSLTATSDDKGNIYSFWVQIPQAEVDQGDATIVYARHEGEQWSKPSNVISGFDSIPTHLQATSDKQGRILLSWVDGENGDLYFSWANTARANLASEWFEPQQLPSHSQLNSSPDILADDLGRIVVVYTVPLNEDRGVYLVQSTDLGQTWSPPALIFDAVAAGWSLVDQPQVSVSADGKLHVLFTRSSLREDDQLRGLYYSQSADGGMTWSQPQMVSEKNVEWSRIVCLDQQVMHRLWQENNVPSRDIFDQISRDGGGTWENPIKIISQNTSTALPELAESADGHLFITQSSVEDRQLIVDVHEWDGSHWVPQESKELNLEANSAQPSVTTRINNQGVMNVIVSASYPELKSGLQNEVVSFSRTLTLDNSNGSQQPASLQISTPVISSSATKVPGIEVTATELSPLAGVGDEPPSTKNTVGFVLIGVIVFVIAGFLWPKGKKRN
jgi:BNR repeat protein